MTVPRAVAVVGATASGKSALAHAVALESGGDVEILCVDAMSVYRGMDLATAKPSRRERELVAYHLLDLVDASDEYSLEEFQRAARRAAKEVRARGHRVLYVGGTGLYGRAVIDDLEIPGRYPTIRATLDARAASELPALYAELTALDPLAASRMEPTNERRILRALEVTLGAGRPFSSFGAGLSAYPPSTVAQV
ncbi:MAG: tRNA (adenosine(37)-N6)-dimethylallyltransferase MiaA, partial [Acidobacteriota bacterium]|nr:tRNA (adenosine(37)-N6)-dimethylallyltransferase MiaA [Acidobacteriota bacterium]